MGVPSFFKWLVGKYPKVVVDAVEDDGDCGSPNPNELEFDNLYLDMNGIVHPCFHPEDDHFLAPTTFEEVFSNINDYVDRLFNIVRPRKLLFLAIDGVAPRAKMNQQRSRRFRAAKDFQVSEEIEGELRREFELEGKMLVPKVECQVSDYNVITPGTEFMHMLKISLRSYIRQRLRDNLAWTNLKVILSDANVPGEGEHKIMSFIRAQRSMPGYDPNTRHCIYGLDADLIMLALATHELHFSIIRENVLFGKEPTAHLPIIKNGRNEQGKYTSQNKSLYKSQKKLPYQFLHIWIMREYLALDLEITCFPEKVTYDFERVVDDFIFICFFAGNDFLPHIPSLEIHEGVINLLIDVYTKEFKSFGGYLVDMRRVEDPKGGYIKLKRVERFILNVGTHEDQIFKKRAELREKTLRRVLSESMDALSWKDVELSDQQYDQRTADISGSAVVNEMEQKTNLNQKENGRASDIHESTVLDDQILINTKDLKEKIKDRIRDRSDLFKNGFHGTDKVKFGTTGWKERYYKEKFSAETSGMMETVRKEVIRKYSEGLQWVLLYYFSGVPSWTWFYPYHHGPLASDFKGLSQTIAKFEKGLPFSPLDQLMAVLPPESAHALPESFGKLMVDENSVLINFYPKEFVTDVDGKRFVWQGICKLPFIDEKLLLIETKKLEDQLKDTEKTRNSQSLDRLYITNSGKLGNLTMSCDKEKNNNAKTLDIAEMGIAGTVQRLSVADNESDECAGNVVCVLYETRQVYPNVPHLLPGVIVPEKVVGRNDKAETTIWHEELVRNTSNRYQSHSRPVLPPNTVATLSQGSAVPNIAQRSAGSGFLGRGKTAMAARRDTIAWTPTPRGASAHSGWRSNVSFSGNRGYSPSSSVYRAPQLGPFPAYNQQTYTPWDNRQRTSGQIPYELTWRNNQLPMTANVSHGRGRGWHVPNLPPQNINRGNGEE